jgi:ATP-binding cassette, subfamily B, bacterial
MTDIDGWAAGRRIARYRLRRYIPGGALWALNHSLPILVGLVLKVVFDRVSSGGDVLHRALPWLAVLMAVEAGRALEFWSAMVSWPFWWQGVVAWLRGNILHSIVVAPGPVATRMPGSPGEAISRFRDDVDDLTWFVDIWVDVAGGVIFTAVALVIMFSISPLVTIVVVLPMVAVVVGTRYLSTQIRRYHQRTRQSGASVTALIADLFSGVLTLKVAGAEEQALARFRERNSERREAAVRSQLARDLIDTVSGASIEISIGLMLLLAAPAMRRGDFTVGDLALFTSYASWLTGLPRWVGRMLARHREASVALDRLSRLMPSRQVDEVLTQRPVYLKSSPPVPLVADATDDDQLHTLSVRGLTARPMIGRRGIEAIDLDVTGGSFTVVTGTVGAGKTTLLRALLGLLPIEEGTISWNGQPVHDPSTFLVPPRAAYAAQVPRLFSASLEENLRLGWPAAPADLEEALWTAALSDDVDEMHDRLDTLVGPRGMRLSGGQAQRATAARALLRRPSLLLVDDLSSALDTETEARLWDRIIAAGTDGRACIAISHRRPVIERADQVVVLDRGRLASVG